MDKNELMKIIPHRDKMLLVDSAEVQDGKSVGTYKIKGDEWFLQGHFPGHPVVPGVILCEMMAQSCCVLLEGECKDKKLPLFTGLDKVKFRNQVVPGDVFQSECTVTGHKGPFYFASGKGYVKGKLCVSAEFSFAIVNS